MAVTERDLVAIADILYALARDDFTAARDTEAKTVGRSTAGDRVLAARIKELRKPSLAAWVVNHLVRQDGEQVAEILKIAEGLRAAQQAMDGDELRQLTRQRRQLTAAVTTRARTLAAEYGVRVTESVAEQVEATITAALLDEEAAAALRTGMLVQALSAVGFRENQASAAVALPEALGTKSSARPPLPGRPALRLVADPDADVKARAEREAGLSAAQERLSEARSNHAAAVQVHANLQAQALQNEARMDEIRRQLADLQAAQEHLDDELAEAEDAVSEAEANRVEAERSRQEAAQLLMQN